MILIDKVSCKCQDETSNGASCESFLLYQFFSMMMRLNIIFRDDG